MPQERGKQALEGPGALRDLRPDAPPGQMVGRVKEKGGQLRRQRWYGTVWYGIKRRTAEVEGQGLDLRERRGGYWNVAGRAFVAAEAQSQVVALSVLWVCSAAAAISALGEAAGLVEAAG